MQLTVSELIKQLQKIERTHGDSGVVATGSVPTGKVDTLIVIECLEVDEDGDVVLRELC